jgi:hypothetical protein
MQLKIEIRKQQVFNIYGDPVIYSGPNPQSLIAGIGTLPDTAWFDVTKYVTNLDKFSTTWTQNIDAAGQDTPGAFQAKKAASNQLIFEQEAFQFIKAWLWDDVAAPLNRIEVQVTDLTCGTYSGFSIKSTDTQWCENNFCTFEITLKQKDPLWTCIEKTVISDNWQGWFQTVPQNLDGTPKYHPRFSYCIEHRPNAMMLISWYGMSGVAAILTIVGYIIALAINPIIFFIRAIESIVGVSSSAQTQYYDPQDTISFCITLYGESTGCGREHPAPLVRDYIKNVCDKCGVEVDALTAPIFFSPIMSSIQTSSRGTIYNVPNPHYNACYYFPQAKRGIRRIRNNSFFNGPQFNNSDFWINENAPILALDQFLDQQKRLYNAEWTIRNNPITGKAALYFWRKDWFRDGKALYDFTTGSEDRLKLLTGICYTQNELSLPAYTYGLYQNDPIDTCGNEVAGSNGTGQMNGIANFDLTVNNPNFEGSQAKTSGFGGTKFRLDGASPDYIFDTMQELVNSVFLNPFVFPQMKDLYNQFVEPFCDYAVMMSDEICSLPKTLIWDGQSYLNAKAIRNVVPKVTSTNSDPIPVVNPKYPRLLPNSGNPGIYAPLIWEDAHDISTFVQGSSWTLAASHTGVYQVAEYFGTRIAQQPARLVNFPMYFEPGYQDTMWDWFHWIDDPRYNPTMRISFTILMKLCCEDLEKLGLIGDGTGAKIFDKVLLPLPYYPVGIIKEISVDYDSDVDNFGKHIEIKGTA